VSTATLFKHFATKEALVFDEDVDREAQLMAAARNGRRDRAWWRRRTRTCAPFSPRSTR
jgi:AcrR family transcriptional regulator